MAEEMQFLVGARAFTFLQNFCACTGFQSSLLLSMYQHLSWGSEWLGHNSHYSPVSNMEVKICGTIFPLLCVPSWCVQEQLHIYRHLFL